MRRHFLRMPAIYSSIFPHEQLTGIECSGTRRTHPLKLDEYGGDTSVSETGFCFNSTSDNPPRVRFQSDVFLPAI
jgi:hypothetical protein